MKFAKYSKYKRTNIPWLGNVPSHWSIDRLKWSADSVVNGVWGSEPTGDEDTACIRVADFDRVSLRVRLDNLTFRSVDEKEKRRRVLVHGDLLIEKSGGGEQQLVGAVVEFNHQFAAVCSNFVAKVSLAEGMHSRYWAYFHAHLYSGRVNYPSVKQTTGIQNLDSDAYFDELVVYPPYREQEKIATFLDRETARIDTLIEKKHRLLELLEEKRLAIITEAVTKGLDREVPTRYSGIEWLGEVPAHWEIAPVSSRYEVTLGKMLDAKRISGKLLAPYLRNSDVQWDYVNTVQLPEMDFDDEDRQRLSLRLGDLLVCEGGEVGRTAVWRGELSECYFQKAIQRVRATALGEVSRFLYYVMLFAAKKGVFKVEGNPNTIDHLTAVRLRHYRFAFPRPEEEKDIVWFLDARCEAIAKTSSVIKDAISRLGEFRAALITNAVTGQIDVRNMLDDEAAA